MPVESGQFAIQGLFSKSASAVDAVSYSGAAGVEVPFATRGLIPANTMKKGNALKCVARGQMNFLSVLTFLRGRVGLQSSKGTTYLLDSGTQLGLVPGTGLNWYADFDFTCQDNGLESSGFMVFQTGTNQIASVAASGGLTSGIDWSVDQYVTMFAIWTGLQNAGNNITLRQFSGFR